MKKVLAISGSTRAESTQLKYIQAVSQLAGSRVEISVYKGLSQLPAFNPDVDKAGAPAEVEDLRFQLNMADGVLICTPKYAMGIPGSLKNLIDWTVSSGEFSNKPVALITASTSGTKAHQSLIEVLNILGAVPASENQLLIPFAQTKINSANEITDSATLNELTQHVEKFCSVMEAVSMS